MTRERERGCGSVSLEAAPRVMPGLRGTPAGMITRSAPASAAPSWSTPTKPLTWCGEDKREAEGEVSGGAATDAAAARPPLRACAGVLQCDRSAATPGVLAMSWRCSTDTSGFIFSSSDSGCPMPPAAPSTATCGGRGASRGEERRSRAVKGGAGAAPASAAVRLRALNCASVRTVSAREAARVRCARGVARPRAAQRPAQPCAEAMSLR